MATSEDMLFWQWRGHTFCPEPRSSMGCPMIRVPRTGHLSRSAPHGHVIITQRLQLVPWSLWVGVHSLGLDADDQCYPMVSPSVHGPESPCVPPSIPLP